MHFTMVLWMNVHFFFSSRRRHTRLQGDWSSDVCSSDLAGELSEHVIEKRNAGADLIFAGAVEVEADANFCFVCLSRFGRFAWIHCLFSSAWSSAARNRSFSCRSEERRVGKECRSRWSPY